MVLYRLTAPCPTVVALLMPAETPLGLLPSDGFGYPGFGNGMTEIQKKNLYKKEFPIPPDKIILLLN